MARPLRRSVVAMPDLAAAEAFIAINARVLDRHRFAHRWKGAGVEPVLAALAAYATGDGAYGHALESDLRAPLASPAAAGGVAVGRGRVGERHTPLDLSPRPGARSRVLFDAALVDAHLDHLAGAQRDDGGWTFDWMAWRKAASAEWRGIVTLHALDLLAASGRLEQHRQHVDDQQDDRDSEQGDVDHAGEHPAAARSAGRAME